VVYFTHQSFNFLLVGSNFVQASQQLVVRDNISGLEKALNGGLFRFADFCCLPGIEGEACRKR
jgi:hypothetical protein